MKFQLKVQFRNMDESDFIYNDVFEHAEKLERYFDRIHSCEVIVSAPHRHHHKGKIYHVQIQLHTPGKDIFVNTESEKNPEHSDVYIAIRDAFDAAKRQLKKRKDSA